MANILPEFYRSSSATECSFSKDVGIYLQDCLSYLQTFSWVYDFPLTNYFIRDVTDTEHKWHEQLLKLNNAEINHLPLDCTMEGLSEDLSMFLAKAKQLSLKLDAVDIKPTVISHNIKRGMTPKKHHEVTRLSAVIRSLCREQNIHNIVDIGGGLGYLGQVLCQICGMNVLSLESQHCHTERAISRNHDTPNNFKLCTFELQNSNTSRCDCEQLIKDHFGALQSGKKSEKCTDCTTAAPVQTTSNTVHSDVTSDVATNTLSCCSSHRLACCGNTSSNATVQGHNKAKCIDYDCTASNAPSLSDNTCISVCTSPASLSTVTASTSSMPASTLSVNLSTCASNDCTHICSDDMSPTCESGQSCRPTDSDRVCVVGLHCCGSLTPDMLRLFSEHDTMAAIVCISCCYHKINMHDGSWPMSNALREAITAHDALPSDWTLSIYALRLAAQETRSRWVRQSESDHAYHTQMVAYRGVVEYYCHHNNLDLGKTKRKLAVKSQCTEFETYAKSVLHRSSLSEDHMDPLMRAYYHLKPQFSTIETFTLLQVVVQPVIESLILIDRLLYLQEKQLNPQYLPIFDDYVSPRNTAIYAFK